LRYIPATDEDLKEMLKASGMESVEEIFKSIPDFLRAQAALNIPEPLDELALTRHMNDLSSRNINVDSIPSFLGAGAYNHFIPAALNHIISRSEFYTAYTPYQPEISQGTLQSIFEFQTMICHLTGMDVANASMYDGASALAEAVLMALRIKKKAKKVYLSKAVHPEYRSVVATYTRDLEIEIVEIPFTEDGRTDHDWLSKNIEGSPAAVVLQYPNFFGVIEDLGQFSELAAEKDALLVTATAEPVALGLIRPPGDFGVDIAVGEGQPLGNPVNFGGPLLGLFATREKYVRNMPGRLVGETVDLDGKRGYVLTLSTREQHIRREKATSNICSNQSLCALAAAVYLSLAGRKGFREIASINFSLSEYAKKSLIRIKGFSLQFDSPTFNEFVIKMGRDSEAVNGHLLRNRIVGGLPLKRFYPELSDSMLFCVTEKTRKEDIDRLAELLGKYEK